VLPLSHLHPQIVEHSYAHYVSTLSSLLTHKLTITDDPFGRQHLNNIFTPLKQWLSHLRARPHVRRSTLKKPKLVLAVTPISSDLLSHLAQVWIVDSPPSHHDTLQAQQAAAAGRDHDQNQVAHRLQHLTLYPQTRGRIYLRQEIRSCVQIVQALHHSLAQPTT